VFYGNISLLCINKGILANPCIRVSDVTRTCYGNDTRFNTKERSHADFGFRFILFQTDLNLHFIARGCECFGIVKAAIRFNFVLLKFLTVVQCHSGRNTVVHVKMRKADFKLFSRRHLDSKKIIKKIESFFRKLFVRF
jgi:hypothetical protein